MTMATTLMTVPRPGNAARTRATLRASGTARWPAPPAKDALI